MGDKEGKVFIVTSKIIGPNKGFSSCYRGEGTGNGESVGEGA